MGVLECTVSYHRSVTVLWRLYMIKFTPMHPLYGALPVSYEPVQVTRGALVSYRYTCFKTSQYCNTFISCSVSLWNDIGDHVFGGIWDCRVLGTDLILIYWSMMGFLLSSTVL